MRYWANPAHKTSTTEAGPPRWRPDKAKCPPLSVEEREQLFAASIPEDRERIDSPRYAFRLGANGFEWFAGRCTRIVDGEPEYHGYPCSVVPIAVLRQFRDEGRLTDAQYRKLIKEVL